MIRWFIRLFRKPKPVSPIRNWSGWPNDVQKVLLTWNKERRLWFPQHGTVLGLFGHKEYFVCSVCNYNVETSNYGDAELDGRLYCDDCLIEYVRDKFPK